MWLVRLTLQSVRGCRPGVLVSVFSVGEKSGPQPWTLKSFTDKAETQPHIPGRLPLNTGGGQAVSSTGLFPAPVPSDLGQTRGKIPIP